MNIYTKKKKIKAILFNCKWKVHHLHIYDTTSDSPLMENKCSQQKNVIPTNNIIKHLDLT